MGSAIGVGALCCALLGFAVAALLIAVLMLAWEGFLFYKAGTS